MFKYSDNMQRENVGITVIKSFLVTSEKETKREPVNLRRVSQQNQV